MQNDSTGYQERLERLGVSNPSRVITFTIQLDSTTCLEIRGPFKSTPNLVTTPMQIGLFQKPLQLMCTMLADNVVIAICKLLEIGSFLFQKNLWFRSLQITEEVFKAMYTKLPKHRGVNNYPYYSHSLQTYPFTRKINLLQDIWGNQLKPFPA